MMKVRAQFFSRLKDVTGCAEREIELRDGATVQDLLAKLFDEFPGLAEWNAHILTAVAVEYVGREEVLKEGNSIAIMPPVQGG
jgi:MoaD family protein